MIHFAQITDIAFRQTLNGLPRLNPPLTNTTDADQPLMLLIIDMKIRVVVRSYAHDDPFPNESDLSI